jgi:NhaP-type Na+/H+ or K+/H+ antiporter
MSEQFLIGLGIIIAFGMIAQWLAWRLHLPSILLLLVLGIFAGPVSGLVDTEKLFGELLFPFVSISVGIILFEGGLSLRFSEFRNVGAVIRNLISIGALVTWIIATLASYYILEFEFKLALLFGAILIVTGPTVILPLLRQVRPKGNLYSIAKWEGIMIDPVGAIIAVLVFEEIITGGFVQFNAISLIGLGKTIVIGLGIGWFGTQLIIIFLRRYWIPDFLHNSAAIMLVITSFIISNLIQHESGLLTVTVMGIVLANQKKVSIKHIIEFKENLRVILISSLFIVLAARLNISDFTHLNMRTFIFLAVLILLARPLTVFISTIGQKTTWQERIFLSWLAPRGIVAAAVSSVFAIELSANGYPDAARLIPITFIVIITTVTIYGLSAVPLARWLKLSEPNPQGLLIVGAHNWARQLAVILKQLGHRVLLIDSNPGNVEAAHSNNLEAINGNVLAEDIADRINLQGIGRLLAVTPNDEVNALASLHFVEIFGRSEVYQLPYKESEKPVSSHLRGRCLFDKGMSFKKINDIFNNSNSIQVIKFETEDEVQNFDTESMLPLIMINTQNQVFIFTDEENPKPGLGTQLICLKLNH